MRKTLSRLGGAAAVALLLVTGVVRAHGSSLPLRADGLTVNEEALDPVVAGTLEPGDPGSRRGLQVHLVPGRYELFCNMSGHYLGGMHTDLVVR